MSGDGKRGDGHRPPATATIFDSTEAALGLMSAITKRVEADPRPQPEELSAPFWNACHGGQLAAAQYLLVHGADLNWPAPWSGQTPLDIAEQAGWSDVVAWLIGQAASRGKRGA